MIRLFLAVLCLVAVSCNRQPIGKGTIKNIILVTLDTTRADALGSYGNKLIQTPVLDTMAREGHRFSQAYVHAPITLPSHSSIFTGLTPPKHGVRNNISYALSQDHHTLAEYLKNAGYATSAFISSIILDSRFGLDQGFDVYEDEIVHYKDDRTKDTIVTRRAEATLDLALPWISKQEGPFFSWLHFYDPHWPYEAPLPFRQAYANNPYFGEVAYLDFQLNRLVKTLQRLGIYEETLIVITADHGESLNQHREATHGFFCYNATTHVPLILSQPIYGEAGQVFEHQVSSVDLLPSLLEILGQPIPRTEGILLHDDQERLIYSEAIIPAEDYYMAPVHSFKDNRYSFYYSSELELYDRKYDPKERRNLLENETERVNDYQTKMEALIAQSTSNSIPLDQESIELLRSLGYIADGGSINMTQSDPYKFRSPLESVETFRQLQNLRGFQESFPFKMIEGLEQLIEKDRRQVILYRDLGRLYTFQGNKTKAIDNLKKATMLKPEDPRLHTFLGLGHQHFEDHDLAIEEFEVALKLDPEHNMARYNLGISFVAKERYKAAAQAFRGVIKRNKKDLLALNNLAYIQWQYLAQPKQALDTIKKAYALNSEHPLVKWNHDQIQKENN